MHNNISLSKRRREKEYLYMHSVHIEWNQRERKTKQKMIRKPWSNTHKIDHTKQNSRTKQKIFVLLRLLLLLFLLLFCSFLESAQNEQKKRTKDKKEHIAWFVSFVLGRFACVATRTICPIFKCILDIVQIYRYRYWYSCSFCIWQFQLRQCFCFALLCVRSFLLFELNSPWLDFCVQTDRPTDGTERATINFKS